MRVLVAEDDPGLRDVLVMGLEDHGYQVDAAERGDEAIDLLKFYDYDVAVVDWRMPGAEGIDVVAWARKHGKPTAILMLTARDAPPIGSAGWTPARTTTWSSRSTSGSCWLASGRCSGGLAASMRPLSCAARYRSIPSAAR